MRESAQHTLVVGVLEWRIPLCAYNCQVLSGQSGQGDASLLYVDACRVSVRVRDEGHVRNKQEYERGTTREMEYTRDGVWDGWSGGRREGPGIAQRERGRREGQRETWMPRVWERLHSPQGGRPTRQRPRSQPRYDRRQRRSLACPPANTCTPHTMCYSRHVTDNMCHSRHVTGTSCSHAP